MSYPTVAPTQGEIVSTPTALLPIEPLVGGFAIPGIAYVSHRPHRSEREARELIERIAHDPAAYLSVCTDLKVPGVSDLRRCWPGRAAAPLTLAEPVSREITLKPGARVYVGDVRIEVRAVCPHWARLQIVTSEHSRILSEQHHNAEHREG